MRADIYFSRPALSTTFKLKRRSCRQILVTLMSRLMVTKIRSLNSPSKYRAIRDDFPTLTDPRTKSWIVGIPQWFAIISFCLIFEDCNRSVRISSSARGLLKLLSSIQRKTISFNLFFPTMSISCLRRSFSGIFWPSVQQKKDRVVRHPTEI